MLFANQLNRALKLAEKKLYLKLTNFIDKILKKNDCHFYQFQKKTLIH